MCMRMGPLFSVRRNEQLGSWEEMLLYHYSLCVTLCSIWTAVGGIIIVFFWPCDETGMRFLICFYWVCLLALRLDCYLQRSCVIHVSMKYLRLVELGLKTIRLISKHFKSDIWTFGFILSWNLGPKKSEKNATMRMLDINVNTWITCGSGSIGLTCLCKKQDYQQFPTVFH